MKSLQILAASILLASVSTFTYSCKSDELSRSEAERLLRIEAPKQETREFEIYRGYSNGEGKVIRLCKRLKDLGLVNYENRPYFIDAIDNMQLTEKGKQYVVNQRTHDSDLYANCKVSDLEFGGATGVSQQKGTNTALVKYTQVRKITPFGTALNLNDGPFEVSVTFTKFDDGWRINK